MRAHDQPPDPRDTWYAVVMASIIAGVNTIDQALENVKEGAPWQTWAGTILLGIALFILALVVGIRVNRWLRRKGYTLDDD
jgi:tellurite resistance protein TehA-like permease